MNFVRFSSIERLHNLIRNVEENYTKVQTTGVGTLSHPYDLISNDLEITYKAKIKLHGVNSGVTIHRGELRVQSRNIFVDEPGKKSFGFLEWVNQSRDVFFNAWKNLEGMRNKDEVFTIFGEWCGPGVQKGVAVSKVKRKFFCCF